MLRNNENLKKHSGLKVLNYLQSGSVPLIDFGADPIEVRVNFRVNTRYSITARIR